MADTEHVFYIAGASVVTIYGRGDYRLWLLDLTNDNSVAAWRGGAPVPPDQCVRVNCGYTFERPGPAGEVHCVDDHVVEMLEPRWEERISHDAWRYLKSPATVAVSDALWKAIPDGARPLPLNRAQPYRLRLVARRSDSGKVRYYLGFHVKVLEIGIRPTVQFVDWISDVLGDQEVDLASDVFDPPARGHTTLGTTPAKGDEGALFVALDGMATIPFLVGPKVPYAAGTRGRHASLLSERGAAHG